MKGNALKSYAKKSAVLQMMRVDGRQWLGVRNACYPMDGYPSMNEETLLTVLEFDEKKRKEHTVQMRLDLPEEYQRLMEDARADEQPNVVMTDLDISLPLAGCYRLVYTPEGSRWIDASALKPLDDVLERCTFHYRKGGSLTVVAVMLGMQNVGLLSCTKLWVNELTVATLKRAVEAAEAALRETRQERGGEQIRMGDE